MVPGMDWVGLACMLLARLVHMPACCTSEGGADDEKGSEGKPRAAAAEQITGAAC